MSTLTQAPTTNAQAPSRRQTGRREQGGFARLSDQLIIRLFAPVDIASIVFFRIAFGLVAFLHVWQQIDDGRARNRYVDVDLHFTFYGFDWVKPVASSEFVPLMYFVMAGSAVLIMLGLWYRPAAVIFFVTHTYVFLLDQSAYWNHYYLISLIGFLLIFVPANRAFSLDVARDAVAPSEVAPAWALWILRAQIAIAYFFAGVAKTGADWLGGYPMEDYLSNERSFPFIAEVLNDASVAKLFAYSGMLFDLLIVPLLLWRVTRIPALLVALGFHTLNSLMFDIEIFPWLAIAATLLFISPSWPRVFARPPGAKPPKEVSGAEPRRDQTVGSLSTTQKLGVGILLAYFAIQILLPLRHHFYPGNVDWTQEGYYFAWRMLVARQDAEVEFFVEDKATGTQCEVVLQSFLKPYQLSKLPEKPDMMVQLAHYLHRDYEERGQDVAVYARSSMKLNGRRARPLVDPTLDLAQQKRGLHVSWIAPMDGPPLPPRERGIPDCRS